MLPPTRERPQGSVPTFYAPHRKGVCWSTPVDSVAGRNDRVLDVQGHTPALEKRSHVHFAPPFLDRRG